MTLILIKIKNVPCLLGRASFASRGSIHSWQLAHSLGSFCALGGTSLEKILIDIMKYLLENLWWAQYWGKWCASLYQGQHHRWPHEEKDRHRGSAGWTWWWAPRTSPAGPTGRRYTPRVWETCPGSRRCPRRPPHSHPLWRIVPPRRNTRFPTLQIWNANLWTVAEIVRVGHGKYFRPWTVLVSCDSVHVSLRSNFFKSHSCQSCTTSCT